jgi:pyridoxal phosphate enzyme (YggS family)
MNPIAANLTAVKSRIDAACQQAGRPASEVRLLPVSKTRTTAEIVRARSFGLSRFGENRAQEARDKARELAGTGIEWAIIGHLQPNKAKYVAEVAAEFQALDSLAVAEQLDRRLQALGKGLPVLIQVNTSAEPQKHGLAPEAVLAFAKALTPYSSLQVRGLMTIALNSPDQRLVAGCFELLRAVQRRLRDQAVPGQAYDELSMGMSSDFELAIACGSTCVRVGEAIFGPRPAQ